MMPFQKTSFVKSSSMSLSTIIFTVKAVAINMAIANLKHCCQVGGLRFAPPLPDVQYLSYTCLSCAQIYWRRRQLDVKKYRCGKCRGKLVLNAKQDKDMSQP
jgi:DNA-directed RNA polymerase subunit RPC12/RpoP